MARTAERGKFDSIFFADSSVLHCDVRQRPYGTLEPTVLLSAITAVIKRIGLIATASTTYNDPYNLARRFASLDHISGGRAGWNVVTTAGEAAARNFSLPDQPAHWRRYERAAEFLDASRKLWDSWEDDAPVGDKAAGVWADSSRVHAVNHTGRYFRIQGPLDVPRPTQGHPVIVQAGSSEDGKGFRRPLRRGSVHRAADPGGGPAVLLRPEREDGRRGPRPGKHQDPTGHRPGHRLHGAGSAAAGTAAR